MTKKEIAEKAGSATAEVAVVAELQFDCFEETAKQ
jgi:hypothetical protein